MVLRRMVWLWVGCGACGSGPPPLPSAVDFSGAVEPPRAPPLSETPDEAGDSADSGPGDSGLDPPDADADGHTPPEDCDDTDATVHPGAEEVCDNGRDDDCDGVRCRWTGAAPPVWTARRGDSAGAAVALGDVTGDGRDDVLLGAPDATGGPRAGTVWLLSEDPTDGDIAAHGRSLGPDGSVDGAGRTVLVPGDLDGNGVVDLVVGTHHVPGTAPGRLVVLLGPLGADARLDAPDAVVPVPAALALQLFVGAGPADSTGATLLVGAPMDGGGRVRLLAGPWTDTVDLHAAVAEWTAVAGEAGRAVASPGDLDGDGVDDVLIGVPGEGGVGVFLGPHGGGAVEDADLWLSGAGDTLGTAVVGVGDVDGDGGPDVLAATAVGLGDRGRAGLFCGRALAACAELVGREDNDQLGHALTSVGDTDGDGFADLALAAHGTGHLAVWFGPVTGVHSLDTADAGATAGGQAGFSLAGSPGRVVAGAPTAGTDDPPAGGVAVLDFPGF